MARSLTGDDILLISDLIEKNSEKTMKHVSTQIRMVKTTVQENHSVSTETRDLAKKTNGRVTKLEDEIYGEVDIHGDTIKGKEGILKLIIKNL